MRENSDVRAIASLLEDRYAHAILIHTSEESMSATELSEACDASASTIYRRIDRLKEYDLLSDQLRLDRNGRHYKTYSTRLERITIELVDGGFEIEVTYHPEDPADRFSKGDVWYRSRLSFSEVAVSEGREGNEGSLRSRASRGSVRSWSFTDP